MREQMLSSFKVVNALHSYFSQTAYHNSDKDASLRAVVEETLREIGLISTKVSLKPAEEGSDSVAL